MDDTRRYKDGIPLILEDNWLTYFVHFTRKSFRTYSTLNNEWSKTFGASQSREQFPSSKYLITENEIFIAAKILQNNKSAFSDKIKAKWSEKG